MEFAATQTRWIRSWVRAGVVFRTTIRFTNLSASELGALLGLLTLGAGEVHRLGMGKPLGFGSVRLSTDLGDCEIASGAGMRELYVDGETEWLTADRLEGFVRSVADGSASWSIWTKLARGYDVPVHYPRTTPREQQPEGFTWFVQNERGSKLGLPDVTGGSQQLPYSP
jgi:hypothetical protein